MSGFAIACIGIIAVIFSWLLAQHPRLALVIWLGVMTCVPVWLSVSFITTWTPLSLAAILVLPATVRAAQRRGGLGRVEILLVVFVVLATVSFALMDTPQFAYATVFVQWLPAYFVGRYLAPECGRDWTVKMLATAGAVAAAWSILEFVSGVHLFEALVDSTASWHTIQVRGPFARSEGAFGHSIAFGAFIALGIPFILSAKWTTRRRLLLLGVALAGVILTFSRGAIIGAVVALVAGIFALPELDISRKLRRGLIVLVVLLSATLLPFVLSLFAGVSADLDPSTAYRANLVSYIFADMQPFGPALNMEQARNGRYVYHGFGSIDNAYILAVLQYGWLPLLALLIPLVAAVLAVFRRRSVNAAQVAMVGQVWIMGTVALITQYGMAVWFVAGLAVALSRPPQAGREATMADSISLAGRSA
jgi:hypothetical protein